MKRKTINQALGGLEAEIMEIVWKLETVSVRQVFSQLKKKRKIAYTTIMTVMARLSEKGILKRKLDDTGAYIYAPTKAKQDFFATASKKVISNLIKEFGEVAVAQFIDVVESSDLKDLEKWQKKLKGIK